MLNAVSKKLPFFVSQAEAEAEAPREELRLKHRVLDLRCDSSVPLRLPFRLWLLSQWGSGAEAPCAGPQERSGVLLLLGCICRGLFGHMCVKPSFRCSLAARRPKMAANLRLRHKMVRCIRRFLEDEHDFIEVCMCACMLSTWRACCVCCAVHVRAAFLQLKVDCVMFWGIQLTALGAQAVHSCTQQC